MISKKFLFLFILLLSGFNGAALAHTVDSVGDYRLEIGWMNEPVISSEINGIELFISPLEPDLPLEEQEFKNGIVDLEKSLKIQLVYKGEKITLPLSADHNTPGKYYAYVFPSTAGFYQANILGNIGDTIISLSMHPPKVDERDYIEFPEPSDVTLNQIINAHTTIVGDINDLKESLDGIKQSNQQMNIGYIGIGLGITGIVFALIAISKTKKS